MEACRRSSHWEVALELWRQGEASFFQAEVTKKVKSRRASTSRSTAERAKNRSVHFLFQGGSELNIYLAVAVVRASERGRQWRLALEVFEKAGLVCSICLFAWSVGWLADLVCDQYSC